MSERPQQPERPDPGTNNAPLPGPTPVPPTVVQVLAALTALLGVAMIVTALSGGGGIGSYGVLIGVLFVAAGVLRLKLIRGTARAAEQPTNADDDADVGGPR